MSNIKYIPPKRVIEFPKKPQKKQKKADSLKRGRLLKRKGFAFEPFDYNHAPYAWAAYKRGAFKPEEWEGLEPDWDAPTFTAWLFEQLRIFMAVGGDVVTLIGTTKVKDETRNIPLGLAVIEYKGKVAYPHAIWFPDSSPRNRLEIGLAFFLELKKNNTGLVISDKKNEAFFLHLCKYGVLRRVGQLWDWYEDGDRVKLFQTVGR